MKPAYSIALCALYVALAAVMLLFDFVLQRLTFLYDARIRKYLTKTRK